MTHLSVGVGRHRRVCGDASDLWLRLRLHQPARNVPLPLRRRLHPRRGLRWCVCVCVNIDETCSDSPVCRRVTSCGSLPDRKSRL